MKRASRSRVLAAAWLTVGYGVPMGLLASLGLGLRQGMLLGLVAGLAFAGLMLGFAELVAWRMMSRVTLSEAALEAEGWAPGERLLFEGTASHFDGAIANGGILTLTTQRLRFRGHALNVRRYELSLNLADIQSVAAAMTAWVVPNGLLVTLRAPRVERFAVTDRHAWESELQDALHRTRTQSYRASS